MVQTKDEMVRTGKRSAGVLLISRPVRSQLTSVPPIVSLPVPPPYPPRPPRAPPRPPRPPGAMEFCREQWVWMGLLGCEVVFSSIKKEKVELECSRRGDGG